MPLDEDTTQLSSYSHKAIRENLDDIATDMNQSFVASSHYAQQIVPSIELASEQLFVADYTASTLVLDPGGLGSGSNFLSDIPDLMLKESFLAESSNHEQHKLDDIQVHQGLLDSWFTPGLCEQDAPSAQFTSHFRPRLQPVPSITDNTYTREAHDHILQLQSMSAALEILPSALTKTEQADRVLVFHSQTGRQHKPTIKKIRRKRSHAQLLNRRLIRNRGGQCESCRGRKRRVG